MKNRSAGRMLVAAVCLVACNASILGEPIEDGPTNAGGAGADGAAPPTGPLGTPMMSEA